MPEAASIMLAVCAVAPYLRMRTFTLRELEDGLLLPEGSELMNLFLSRWLIRDPKVSVVAGGLVLRCKKARHHIKLTLPCYSSPHTLINSF